MSVFYLISSFIYVYMLVYIMIYDVFTNDDSLFLGRLINIQMNPAFYSINTDFA